MDPSSQASSVKQLVSLTVAQGIGTVYSLWIEALNDRNWDAALQLLGPRVVHNGDDSPAEEFLRRIWDAADAATGRKTTVETLIVGNHGDRIAARLIHRAVVAGVGPRPVDWPEHVLCGFEHGKLARVTSLSDTGARGRGSAVPRTPPLKRASAPDGFDMEAAYRGYIAAINGGAMRERLGQFCQPRLAHNGRRLDVDQYRALIEDSFARIRGLTFTIRELVADDESQQVAARLEFGGRPVEEFMGIAPTGKDVRFWEHVLYRLDGGKIVWVWSMLDLEAYRRCMEE